MLKEIEQLETMNDRPLVPAVIAGCGKCEYVFQITDISSVKYRLDDIQGNDINF